MPEEESPVEEVAEKAEEVAEEAREEVSEHEIEEKRNWDTLFARLASMESDLMAIHAQIDLVDEEMEESENGTDDSGRTDDEGHRENGAEGNGAGAGEDQPPKEPEGDHGPSASHPWWRKIF